MAGYSQTNRLLQMYTPLAENVLLAAGFHGSESISQLFHFNVDCLAELSSDVDFSKLIGQGVTVSVALPTGSSGTPTYRHFHGICNKVSQGESDELFKTYRLELVPQFWLLTKRTQSRIFQQESVKDILKKVLTGVNVTWELTSNYEKRDYCVQYRESDFDFASRLMQEEGIFYFFEYAKGSHAMVVADGQASFRDMPFKSKVTYKNMQQGAPQNEDFIYTLNKSQMLTSGKVLLWDHCFEQPHKKLESDKVIQDSVSIGAVSHKLKLAENEKLELYDYPGEYAQRFDGIAPGGGEQPAELQKIHVDNKRTTALRMEQEAVQAVLLQGKGNCRQFCSGHKLDISSIANDVATAPLKCDGKYLITQVQHQAKAQVNFGSGTNQPFTYSNTFEAIPLALPFRPERTIERPVVPGTQTAVVVGPSGEEIYTDKYGRVKVQFHWDREGKYNGTSSCWVRVSQPSAGRQWGMIHIPRIGQEVIVDFQEGDPDQPIIIGSVYNPSQMPSYQLPQNKTMSYVRTSSSLNGVGYNEIRFEDAAGREQVYLHAQKDMDERVRNDSFERVGHDRHLRVGFYLAEDHKSAIPHKHPTAKTSGDGEKKGSQLEEIAVNKHLTVHKDHIEHIGGDMKLLIGGIDGDGNLDVHIKKKKHELIDDTSDLHVKLAAKELYDDTYDWHVKKEVKQKFDSTFDEHIKETVRQTFDMDQHLAVKQDKNESIGGKHSLSVKGDSYCKIGGATSHQSGDKFQQKVGTNYALEAGQEVHIKGGMKVIIEAGMQLSLKGPGGFVDIGPSGVTIQGIMVKINSGGSAGSGSGASPAEPVTPKPAFDAADAKDAKDAAPTRPTNADCSGTGAKSND